MNLLDLIQLGQHVLFYGTIGFGAIAVFELLRPTAKIKP